MMRAVETYLAYAPWRAEDNESLKIAAENWCKANNISEGYSRPPYMFVGENWQPTLMGFLTVAEEAPRDADVLGKTHMPRIPSIAEIFARMPEDG